MTLLEVRDLSAGYGPIRAIDGVSLSVGTGEIVTILGANAAGKSTLLLAITGVVRPAGGSIRFRGRRIDGEPPHRIVRRGIAHCPEGRRIFPRLTVRENLELGGYTQPDRWQLKRDIQEACELFPVLAARMRQLGGTLSGGEQQMLAVARAVVARPRLLLLDEPSLGLAPRLSMQIFDVIAALPARGVSVLLVEQNAHAGLQLASRGYVLERGRVVLEGEAATLAENPRVREAYLGV